MMYEISDVSVYCRESAIYAVS